MDRLVDPLRDALATGRLSIQAANTLSWLSQAEQHEVSHWLDTHSKRKIGSYMARRLTAAKASQQDEPLTGEQIAALLTPQNDGRTTRRWVAVPLSDLPAGLDYEQARQWVGKAIEWYRRHDESHD